ncbi:hypothetical protein F7725_022408 [Dissostichus mawsoni]|uniref:Protein arginine N-methyltransferase n=1 Tax=Dissostichus mawsoni TaxID=36200 RepID=A0A7J5YYV2_DISMA|nr:hypothetical protein F7725_022408 [Dissostichus mawsoni]
MSVIAVEAEMKTFCGRANPTTGALDWVEESEEYDYHQEIARSCYADMLHDHDRNLKYYQGIRAAVGRVKARGEKVIVLDIGQEQACCFQPMAEAAQSIVKKNGFSERSRSLTNTPLTSLWGQEGCEAVPHRATVYAQLVESELLWSWAQLQPVEVEGTRLVPLPTGGPCAGAHAVCDIQLSQVPPTASPRSVLSAPCSVPQLSVCGSGWGRAQVVLSWWDLDMDPSGSIVCTMAPSWTYKQPKTAPWRDHWMQSVYFLPVESSVSDGEELRLTVCHDDYSLWYSLQSPSQQGSQSEAAPSRPCCTCQAHLVWNRPRFGELNDRQRTESYVSALRSVLREDSVCLGVSDGSLLPVFAHMLGAKKVYGLESSRMSEQVIEQVLEANSMKGAVELLEIRPEQLSSKDLGGEQISVLMGEPYFSTSLLPWHSLFFWYCRTALAGLLHPDAAILPRSATLHMAAVEFQDLWRIRAPCGTCEGFDVTPMDEMVQRSLDFRESREAEPHPLWEYPCRALTPPTAVMTFDFTQCVPQKPISSQGSLPFTRIGRCHGVALWMEYHLTDDITVSAGLIGPVSEQGECEWSRHRKQGVYFFRSPGESSGDGRASVSYSFTFEPSLGDIKMDFRIEAQ